MSECKNVWEYPKPIRFRKMSTEGLGLTIPKELERKYRFAPNDFFKLEVVGENEIRFTKIKMIVA